jgi:hypothetical protein
MTINEAQLDTSKWNSFYDSIGRQTFGIAMAIAANVCISVLGIFEIHSL